MKTQLERRITQLEQTTRSRQAEPPNPHGKVRMSGNEIVAEYFDAFTNVARLENPDFDPSLVDRAQLAIDIERRVAELRGEKS